MRIIATMDYKEMSGKAAAIIADLIKSKPDCVLGLATGSSPEGTYKDLVQRYQAGELDFSAVRSVNLDEYVGLAPDHDQSYAYFMHHHLFDHVNIDPAWDNEEMAELVDLKIEVQAYATQEYGFHSCFDAITAAFDDDFHF